MFLLLLQGSLMYTKAHTKRWWTLTMEVIVLVHVSMVAYAVGDGLWPMFFFGFGGVFIITQMHGVGLKLWAKLVVLAAYLGATVAVYNQLGWSRVSEIFRIPVVDYLAVLVLAGLMGGGLWIVRRLRRPQSL